MVPYGLQGAEHTAVADMTFICLWGGHPQDPAVPRASAVPTLVGRALGPLNFIVAMRGAPPCDMVAEHKVSDGSTAFLGGGAPCRNVFGSAKRHRLSASAASSVVRHCRRSSLASSSSRLAAGSTLQSSPLASSSSRCLWFDIAFSSWQLHRSHAGSTLRSSSWASSSSRCLWFDIAFSSWQVHRSHLGSTLRFLWQLHRAVLHWLDTAFGWQLHRAVLHWLDTAVVRSRLFRVLCDTRTGNLRKFSAVLLAFPGTFFQGGEM